MMEKLLTPQEIADILKLKKTTVYEMLKRGEIPSSKLGKQIRVREADFQNYLKQRGGDPDTVSSSYGESSGSKASPSTAASTAMKDQDSYVRAENSLLREEHLKKLTGLVISGQNPAVDLLCAHIEAETDGFPILHSSQNSYNSLYALYFNKIHAACVAFGNSNSEQNTVSYVRHLLPGMAVVRIHLASLSYGIYCRRENADNLQTVGDLVNDNIRFINREKGSTSRILLDDALIQADIDTEGIYGYHKEVLSDLSCASAIASGKADAAVGSSAILPQFPTLTMIPLEKVDLELIFAKKHLSHPVFQTIIKIAQSDYFKTEIAHMPGYDASHTGEIIL